jgi:hypothetical protein
MLVFPDKEIIEVREIGTIHYSLKLGIPRYEF